MRTNRWTAVLICLVMVLSLLPMGTGALAEGETYTVDFGNGTYSNGQVTVTANKSGVQTLSETDTITLTGFDPDTMQIRLTGENNFTTYLTAENGSTSLSTKDAGALPSGTLSFGIEFAQSKPVTVTIETNAEIAVQLRSTAKKENDTVYYTLSDGSGYLFETGEASGLPAEGNIYIVIEPRLGMALTYESVIINSETKTFKSGTSPNVYEVPVAEAYTIQVTAKTAQSYTIMWTNSGATNVEGTDFASGDCIIGNGKAFVRAIYKSTEDGADITSQVKGHGSADSGFVDGDGKGYVALEEGNVVVFEFIPDYGHQLTAISGSHTTIGAVESLNEYSFVMPASHVHFNATFTPTANTVDVTAENIADSGIRLADNALEGGTARLEVSDTEISNHGDFEEAAEGYEIAQYLDISLRNIFYKGKNDSEDVWSREVTSLEEPAQVTLQLEEGTTSETVKLVHEKDNGQYELLNADYDPQTRKITFETNGFSRYAIAVEPGSGSGPEPVPEEVYYIDLGTGSWTVGDVTVSLPEGINGVVEMAPGDPIPTDEFTGFDPETMDLTLTVSDGFVIYLDIDEEGNTALYATRDGVELPPYGEKLTFAVVEKQLVPEEVYYIDLGTGSWTVGDVTVSLPEGINGVVEMAPWDPIPTGEFTGFDPETMDLTLTVEDGFVIYLDIDEEGITALDATRDGVELPPPGAILVLGIAARPGSVTVVDKTQENACQSALDMTGREMADLLPLTKEEISRLDSGEDLLCWIDAQDITTSVSAGDMKLLQAHRGNASIAVILDITLLRQLGGDDPVAVRETHGDLTVTLKVPQKWISTDPSVTRTYRMLRIHEGVTETLPCTYSAKTETVSFLTDGFSTYALIYEDSKGAPSQDTTLDDVPKAADPLPLPLICSLALLLAAGALLLVRSGITRRG